MIGFRQRIHRTHSFRVRDVQFINGEKVYSAEVQFSSTHLQRREAVSR